MNYIVIDLEWNQSPWGRGTQKKNLPFEIIEIGAIKLDENRKEIDRFNRYIRPQVYKEIHYKTQEIIHVNIEDLKQGDLFTDVIHEFFQWCGDKEYRFCTWGISDLTELQRNMDYYKIEGYLDRPIFYYDIQKLFSLNYEGKKNPKSLEHAVDFLHLEKKEEFHRAIYDAEYTVKVFQELDFELVKEYYSVECYHHPITKEEEIYVVYEKYAKFISREFDTKEDIMADKEIRSTICYKCGRRTPKKIRWFTNNCKNYYSVGYCKEHGFLKGKIRIKRSYNGKVFVVKTLKLIGEEEVAFIRKKKDEIMRRKKEKIKSEIKKRKQEVLEKKEK